MSNSSADRRSMLRTDGSDLSDGFVAITSPTQQRRGYQRMGSQDFEDDPAPRYTSPVSADTSFGSETAPQGLGIIPEAGIPRRPIGGQIVSPQTPQVSFSSNTSTRTSPNIGTPGLSNPLLTPTWPNASSGTYDGGGLGAERDQGLEEHDIGRGTGNRYGHNLGDDEREINDNDNDNDDLKKFESGCPATHDIHSSRKSWLSISILSLSIYSTVFSALWLVIALVQPRYGRMIHSGGSLTPSTASIVFALFAKTIELSFVTVFVTFLGQVLSRRSLVKASRGVTLAELTMRTWVIQPGFMITHWQNMTHAGMTVLAAITLTASFVGLFYTTASDALVSPHLKYGGWEDKLMVGLVKSSYANVRYVTDSCRTPITTAEDSLYAGATCLQYEYAGQAYHDSINFLDTWTTIEQAGEGISKDLTQRPPPPAMLYDNTTVTGSYVETGFGDVTKAFETYGRIINNVTLSMPHSGILAASKLSNNGILQPADLEGLGEYSVRASVVSPSVNVLCVDMMEAEINPLIYVTFPNARTDTSPIPNQVSATADYSGADVHPLPGKTYLNSTVVDDIFLWGEKYKRQPPVFPMVPIDFNSITNISVIGSDSVYMIIKSPATTNYTVCQVRSYLSPYCSTFYNVSGTTGGHLESRCNDPSDPMRYDKSVPDHPPVIANPDWRDIASYWMLSLSLNTGVSNANASTPRLLSQLAVTMPGWGSVSLNNLKPSLAELIAVMAGSTLLLSSKDSTFYHYWGYTANILDPGTLEKFNATVATEQYTSGPLQRWQGMFYVVLFLVFITNVFCLVYFFLRSGLVTDYTEPQNLFALAVNSPESTRLHGSCGAGPEGEQLRVDWHVVEDDHSGHFYFKEGESQSAYEMKRIRKRRERQVKRVSSYNRLASKRTSWL